MQELSEQQLQVSDKKNIEGVTEKYLQPILEILDRKNIRGVRLLKQGNRVMLLIDKSQLNSMNTDILHAMNMVYPNHVVCIENIENPFDYEELYEDIPSKRIFFRICKYITNAKSIRTRREKNQKRCRGIFTRNFKKI